TRNIEVMARPFPIITGLSTSAAPEGGEVTIRGTPLNNLQSVTIGEIEANVVSSTATEMIITVPSGLQQNLVCPITITTSRGKATAPGKFYVGENLLLNGGFQAGDGDEFPNWAKFNGGDGITATTTDGEAYIGRTLRAVAVGGDPWRTEL